MQAMPQQAVGQTGIGLVTVAGGKGVVIGRGHSTRTGGDSAPGLSNVQNALAGRGIAEGPWCAVRPRIRFNRSFRMLSAVKSEAGTQFPLPDFQSIRVPARPSPMTFPVMLRA